ncbi:MAG: hypothetical protein CMP35_00195 [Rickettsiales bacterium]|nr:hypothetical protein [Rickettsiales bacterium]
MSKSAQNKMIDMQNENRVAQYEMDLENYAFNYGLVRETDADGKVILDENGNPKFIETYDPDGTLAGNLNNKFEYQQQSLELRKEADQTQREYQEETANQNWEQGKSMQQFQWGQEDRIFNKNTKQYEEQVGFNELEYQDSLARENQVLDERFIQAAYQNQGIIQDLYEATGSKGFDKARANLNLATRENTIGYQRDKKLLNVNQTKKSAEYLSAGKQLDILEGRGSGEYQQASQYLDLASKEAENRFSKARLNLDTATQVQAYNFQNETLRREANKASLDTAKQIEDQSINALRASGEAQLTQAGRSQGKAVQSILSELGRQENYLAEALIRGQDMAGARMKQNKLNSLNTIQKAALAEQQINFSTIENINKAMLNVDEINRAMKMSDAKGQIGLDQIQQGVLDTVDNASLDIRQLETELSSAKADNALTLDKLDFDLDMLGSRFKLNQDILKSQLESAVKASEMNKKDFYRSKKQADINAEARRMLDPTIGRDEINLDKFRPVELPEAVYQDPMAPAVGPPPKMGAMQSSLGIGDVLPGAVLGGITAGLGTYGALSGAGAAAAGPWGIAVGGVTTLLGLF